MPILLDMKKKPGLDQWEGRVYNAKDGQTYSSTITPADANHLEIRGCVLGFLYDGESWTRQSPQPGEQHGQRGRSKEHQPRPEDHRRRNGQHRRAEAYRRACARRGRRYLSTP